MGGRIGCHVSLDAPVAAVVCLGYPLCGGGDPTKLRDKVLREMTAPVLFVQGTRDALCPLDLLAQVRGEMRAPNELYIVEEGDHSLIVSKRQLAAQNETQEAVEQRILADDRRLHRSARDAERLAISSRFRRSVGTVNAALVSFTSPDARLRTGGRMSLNVVP